MKRHAALHPLSAHHHHALVLALQIRRAAEASAAGRDEALRKLAGPLLRFWEASGKTHFTEEEQVLLPRYARHVRLDADPEIMRMLADHAEIRARIEDIREGLAATFVPGAIVELGRLLHEHIRLEEDRIFPRIEKALSEIEMESVGSRLTRLHTKNSCSL